MTPGALVLLFPRPEALKSAAEFRERNPDLRMTFHLSFEPSAFLRTFRISEGFFPVKKSDLFVVLCHADHKLVKKIFPDALVKTAPGLGSEKRAHRKGAVTSLCYAGRISPSKNVHLTLLSYACALRIVPELPPLELVGKADNGGNQFEEVWSEDYEKTLRELVRDLGLGEKVIFRGHLEKDDWDKYLDSGHRIYVSTSLMLDENYGVAPREFVDSGHRIVLPAWGGFLDIADIDPGAILVPPVKSGDALWLDPWDMALAIAQQFQRKTTPSSPPPLRENALEAYLPRESSPENLVPSSWAVDIHSRISSVEEEHLFQTGPYRSLHHIPELRAAVIEAYAPTARPPGQKPLHTKKFPWVKEEFSGDLWEKGLSYSADPPTATSQRGP